MSANEPRKHHYIPQFILRKFCGENEQLNYYSFEKKLTEKRNTKKIFMNIDMYRDEINHIDNPVEIENILSKFEQEISQLLYDKILDKDTIVISRKELESLRIFLFLLSFRSDSRMKQYKEKKFDIKTLNYLGGEDIDFLNLWKNEIEALAKCRTYKDIEESKILDDIIKTEFKNDLNGYYMTFFDVRGSELILGDIYPTLEIFPFSNGINIHMHCIYPLSPTRLLLLSHIMFKDNDTSLLSGIKKTSRINNKLIIPPKNKYVSTFSYTENDTFIYKVQKLYENDIKYINSLQLNESRIGFIFRNKDKVVSSIENYNEYENKKHDKIII